MRYGLRHHWKSRTVIDELGNPKPICGHCGIKESHWLDVENNNKAYCFECKELVEFQAYYEGMISVNFEVLGG